MKKSKLITIGCCLLGVAVCILFFVTGCKTAQILSMGIGLIGAAIGRYINHKMITKSEESLREYNIREHDERNIFIEKASKSLTLEISVIAMYVLSLIFYLIGKAYEGNIFIFTLCAMVAIYLVCNVITVKKF
jgi:hypothetical protein